VKEKVINRTLNSRIKMSLFFNMENLHENHRISLLLYFHSIVSNQLKISGDLVRRIRLFWRSTDLGTVPIHEERAVGLGDDVKEVTTDKVTISHS